MAPHYTIYQRMHVLCFNSTLVVIWYRYRPDKSKSSGQRSFVLSQRLSTVSIAFFPGGGYLLLTLWATGHRCMVTYNKEKCQIVPRVKLNHGTSGVITKDRARKLWHTNALSLPLHHHVDSRWKVFFLIYFFIATYTKKIHHKKSKQYSYLQTNCIQNLR